MQIGIEVYLWGSKIGTNASFNTDLFVSELK